MTRILLLLAVTLTTTVLGPSFLAAQAAGQGEGSRPDGWRIVTDEFGADTTAVTFVAMEPGFHLTTGPSGLFFDPGDTARGTYRAEANIHLFEPEGEGAPFGLFVGGSDLAGSYRAYTALLLRASGEFSVLRRLSFTSSETLVDWTSHEAVRGWSDRSEGAQTVENALAVEVRGGEMIFFFNGEEVARAPRTSQGAEGIVGIRAGEDVNLHITSVETSPL